MASFPRFFKSNKELTKITESVDSAWNFLQSKQLVGMPHKCPSADCGGFVVLEKSARDSRGVMRCNKCEYVWTITANCKLLHSMYTPTHKHAYTYTYTHTHMDTYMHTQTQMHTYLYTLAILVHTNTHTHTYIYTHIHTHKHACTMIYLYCC